MSVKSQIRKILSPDILTKYHFIMSWLVALLFGLPARRLKVIGVTGTKGKTSTSNIIWHILNTTGHKCGLVSTAQFSNGEETWLNDLKMTMPGRFKLQKLFWQMIKNKCEYAVLETSSEGLSQSRQAGVNYCAAVFTNLTPEHIEAHGSFEKYKEAKAKLWQTLSKNGLIQKTISVINIDDDNGEYYASFPADKKVGYTLKNKTSQLVKKIYQAQIEALTEKNCVFNLCHQNFNLNYGGEFNVYNTVAAVVATSELGLSLAKIKKSLEVYAGTPGRLEFIKTDKNFEIVVDYAHTAESLEQVYKTLKPQGRLIAVLGSCGGGRDKAKRPILGKLAGQYADIVFVTNEDPYEEDPMVIIKSVAQGAIEAGKDQGEDLFIVFDRRAAIHQAIALATKGDIVVITGKGSEQWLCVADNRKLPWDDRKIVQEEVAKIS